LHWLSTIDATITLLPWHEQDQQQEHQSTKSITTSVNFFDIPTYIPQLLAGTIGKSISFQMGHVHHLQIFLRSMYHPDHLAKEMGPWLTETKQGMWQRQIPLAEITICLGWLLFSTPEYNIRALQRKIQQVTGVEVVHQKWHTTEYIKQYDQNQSNPLGGGPHHASILTQAHCQHILRPSSKISIRDCYVHGARTPLGQHAGRTNQCRQVTSSSGTISDPNRTPKALHHTTHDP